MKLSSHFLPRTLPKSCEEEQPWKRSDMSQIISRKMSRQVTERYAMKFPNF